MKRPTEAEALAVLKAIKRWCDSHDWRVNSADRLRNIRVVVEDYLRRSEGKQT